MNFRKATFFITGVLILTGCKHFGERKENTLTEGTIEYSIQYVDNQMDHLSKQLLPQKIILRFSEDYTRITLEGFMRLFSFELINDFEHDKNITMIRFFDNRYVHFGEKNESSPLFKNMEDFKISKTDSTGFLCGYQTQKAICENFFMDGKPVVIEYTDGIGNLNPNKNNPFHKIDGVLLAFPLKLGNVKIYATAESIQPGNLPDDTFTVRDGYKEISRATMAKTIEEILSN